MNWFRRLFAREAKHGRGVGVSPSQTPAAEESYLSVRTRMNNETDPRKKEQLILKYIELQNKYRL